MRSCLLFLTSILTTCTTLAMQANCLFCQFASNEKNVEKVAEFSHCYVIRDRYPVTQGHLLIIPYHHFDNWFAASEEVQAEMIQALGKMKALLDLEFHPAGYNFGVNCGTAAGQTVMHLHLHLIPRYVGDLEDPRGGVRGVIPAKQKY